MPGKGYDGTLYLGPNAQLYAQYGGQEKYLAAKKALDEAKKKITNQKQKYEQSNKALLLALNHPTYGYYAQLKQAQLTNNTTLINAYNAQIRDARAKIGENNNQIVLLDNKIKAAQTAFEKKKVKYGDSGSGSGSDTTTSATPGKGPWNFNAPLVKRADFIYTSTTKNIQLPKMIPAGTSSQGDAKLFWSDVNYGKGTIQMDRITNTVELRANAKKEAEKNGLKFDDKMYGFRFQYNPKEVTMTWGAMMGANPVYEAAGKDPSFPMTSNLMTGTIQFDIIINRIQDLALLDKNGNYIYGENPYPWDISTTDRKTIVQKGTMYDLEYLFRTMHGYAFYTNFEATLMGKTNDPGWLPVRPVELHLGNKLRYRVRIGSLEVVHRIFTEKMVPIFSVVTLSCNRYWDGPVAKDPKKK